VSGEEVIIFCNECNTEPGKQIRYIDVPVCEECQKLPKYNFITKTDAKNEYLVKDEDLAELESHKVPSNYGRRSFALLFNKLDVMQKSCERHSTSMDELSSVLESKIHAKQAKSAARRIKMQENRTAREIPRRNRLVEALQVAGLDLRSDSKLCQMFIAGERDDLDHIVRRMGEMRYLYDYCHMNECRDEAYEWIKEERQLLGHCDYSVNDIAEEIALRKYSRGRYPLVFPWQQ